MVKTKNAQVGQGQNPEEESTSRGKGKGKRVPSGARVPEARAPDRFISVKEVVRFEEWTRNRQKIARGHRVDLNDMQGMGTISHLFELIGWIPLLIEDEFWIYGYRTYASYTFLLNKMLALWLLHHKNPPTLCDQFGLMGFEKNEDGTFIRGGQDGDDENEEDDDEDQEGMNVEEEESDKETEAKIQRRETRQKKRQERTEEGSSSGSMSHLMKMIASLQTSINTQFDAFDGHFEVLDGKVSNIQERLDALDHKMTDTQERVMRLERGGGDRDDRHFFLQNLLYFSCFFYDSFQTPCDFSLNVMPFDLIYVILIYFCYAK
ncbi:hypothetical protein M9H77_22235 [Catharanthus roseus]|uniref:Uncharacterized protein n=1 Tax=Catharanthus roseus TaxID=4058 RepID=A0ACC0ASF8_CATRO|nr:hypothetical protein M9H77_22235 [Catharanthus roseus]